MLYFFGDPNSTLYVLQKAGELSEFDREKLLWLFDGMPLLNATHIEGAFIGPRASMITPWSTNATEIMANKPGRSVIRSYVVSALRRP
jgi:phosphoribosylformylglycinamidine synthase